MLDAVGDANEALPWIRVGATVGESVGVVAQQPAAGSEWCTAVRAENSKDDCKG